MARAPGDIIPVAAGQSGETDALVLEGKPGCTVRAAEDHARPARDELPGEREARIGWAWSTAVDQVNEHVITVASCTPGHCDIREARAAIRTMTSMGCGYCDLDVNPRFVRSPRVIDLFDAVALVWSTHTTERVRVTPLELLDFAHDVVLWEKPDTSQDDQEAVRGRGTVALLGVSVSDPNEGHFFRLDVHEASALARE